MSLFDKINLPAVTKSYKVHTFTGNGTFAVTGSGDVEYLILAGGAGGASYYWAGGGGAGGLLQGTGKSVTAQNYSIVVGSGGAVQSTQHTAGNNGSNSSALGLTSIGGGGGNTNGAGGNDGGSGGGSGGDSIGQASGQPTVGQGFAGGIAGNPSGTGSGSGGGGSGSVGIQATSGVGGNGGDGISSTINGSIVFYGAGGAGGGNGTGGQGGQGGGGNGSAGSANGSNATGYGSGGGGGAHASGSGGSGSNGITIIRYLTSSGITATGGTVTNISELTGVANQRVVDNFSGSVLDTDRWATNQIYGGSTVAMKDEIDGGIILTGGGTSNAKITLGFNNIRQFSHSGSVFIGSHKFSATQASTIQTLGLSSTDTNPRSAPQNASLFSCTTGQTVYYVESGDGTGGGYNAVSTSKSVDTNYHVGKLALDGVGTDFSVDGVFEVRKTTGYPTAKMQPVIHLNSDVTATLNVNYVEAYNT